jgi:hypothetical protein
MGGKFVARVVVPSDWEFILYRVGPLGLCFVVVVEHHLHTKITPEVVRVALYPKVNPGGNGIGKGPFKLGNIGPGFESGAFRVVGLAYSCTGLIAGYGVKVEIVSHLVGSPLVVKGWEGFKKTLWSVDMGYPAISIAFIQYLTFRGGFEGLKWMESLRNSPVR